MINGLLSSESEIKIASKFFIKNLTFLKINIDIKLNFSKVLDLDKENAI